MYGSRALGCDIRSALRSIDVMEKSLSGVYLFGELHTNEMKHLAARLEVRL